MESTSGRRDILTCDITPDNQAELEQGLVFAADHRHMIGVLSSVVRHAILEMGTTYLEHDDYVRFKKLFKNAIPYVAQGRVRREEGGFWVEGNTNDHHVAVDANGVMACDCDLFNGRGQFEDNEGECSHIQAAVLLDLAEV